MKPLAEHLYTEAETLMLESIHPACMANRAAAIRAGLWSAEHWMRDPVRLR